MLSGPEKIKHIIVEAIGNPDGLPGDWKEISFNKSSAERIAETIYQALKNGGYLLEKSS